MRIEAVFLYSFVATAVAVRAAEAGRSLPPHVQRWDDSGHLIVLAGMVVAAIAAGDPVSGLGFWPRRGPFPLAGVIVLIAALGASSWLMTAWLERWRRKMGCGLPVEYPWAASVAAGRNVLEAAALIPLVTGMQTLVEETVFRGVLRIAVSRAIVHRLCPSSPDARGAGPVAVGSFLANVAQACAFGIVHWLPVRACWPGAPRQVRWYCFWVPFAAGLAFGWLNDTCSTLWPGWAVHWAVNALAAVRDYRRDKRGVYGR